MASSKFAIDDKVQKTPKVCKGVRPPQGPKPFPIAIAPAFQLGGRFWIFSDIWQMHLAGNMAEFLDVVPAWKGSTGDKTGSWAEVTMHYYAPTKHATISIDYYDAASFLTTSSGIISEIDPEQPLDNEQIYFEVGDFNDRVNFKLYY